MRGSLIRWRIYGRQPELNNSWDLSDVSDVGWWGTYFITCFITIQNHWSQSEKSSKNLPGGKVSARKCRAEPGLVGSRLKIVLSLQEFKQLSITQFKRVLFICSACGSLLNRWLFVIGPLQPLISRPLMSSSCCVLHVDRSVRSAWSTYGEQRAKWPVLKVSKMRPS